MTAPSNPDAPATREVPSRPDCPTGPDGRGPGAADRHPLAHLVGVPIPGGRHTVAGYESWLGHDALYSPPADEPHPLMAFVAAQRGLDVTVAELFRMWGTEMSDGPMLTSSTLEFPGVLAADVEYRVRGTVTSVVRKTGRTMGVFDLLTARFELLGPDGGAVAVVTNVYALPRNPRRTGSPPKTAGPSPAPDAPPANRSPRLPAPLPEWTVEAVDPEKMKVLALLLADPNPLHYAGTRPVNQGPSNMAMLVNMLRAALPGARLRRLDVQLRGSVLAGQSVRAGGELTARDGDHLHCTVWLTADDAPVLTGTADLTGPAEPASSDEPDAAGTSTLPTDVHARNRTAGYADTRGSATSGPGEPQAAHGATGSDR